MLPAKRDRLLTLVSYGLALLLVLFYTERQIELARSLGNSLSTHGRYSEANGIRAGEAFYDRGFTSNAGLADIAYGHSFDGTGGKRDKYMCPKSAETCVYLHTPPGTEWLAGLATRLFGKGEIGRFRTVPLTVAFLGLSFLAWAMTRGLGPARGLFVLSTFALVPMVTASMHNLSFVNYELAFFELELGVLLLLFFTGLRRNIGLGLLAVIGFLSGWISFDYLAHVCLAAPVIWLLRGGQKKDRKTMLYAVAASSFGYFFACGLHLLQVAVFLGSVRAMVDDYVGRGMARMNGQVELQVKALSAAELVVKYWTEWVSKPDFYVGNFSYTMVLTFLALTTKLPAIRIGSTEWGWRPNGALKWGFLLSLGIPFIWIVFVRQHATAHFFYVPRNFIFTFMTAAMALSLGVERREAAAVNAAGSP